MDVMECWECIYGRSVEERVKNCPEAVFKFLARTEVLCFYSNVLKNLRIDIPLEVSLCRIEVPSERFIKRPAMPSRRICSEMVLKFTSSISEISETESSGSRPRSSIISILLWFANPFAIRSSSLVFFIPLEI